MCRAQPSLWSLRRLPRLIAALCAGFLQLRRGVGQQLPRDRSRQGLRQPPALGLRGLPARQPDSLPALRRVEEAGHVGQLPSLAGLDAPHEEAAEDDT